MRISSLSLSQFACFSQASFLFPSDKNVIVILGENGGGKSSIIHAVKLLLRHYLRVFQPRLKLGIPRNSLHINHLGQRAECASLSASFITPEGIFTAATDKRSGNIADYAHSLLVKLITEQEVTMPILAIYDAQRTIRITGDDVLLRQYSRHDAYRGALKASADYSGVFNRLFSLEKSEKISFVLDAIEVFMDGKYHKPRIELSPLGLSVREKATHRRLDITQLSSGYLALLSMISDLALRMIIANPKLDNPLHAPGIVLIDEIDLHLHPRWQRNIISGLSRIFPNLQFLITTHSPIILSGADANTHVMRVGEMLDYQLDISQYDVGSLLLSPFFGINSLYSPRWDKQLQRRDELLAMPEINEQERDELARLRRELSGLQSCTSEAEIIIANFIKNHDLLRKDQVRTART